MMATPPNNQNPIPPDHQLVKAGDAPKPVQPLPGGHDGQGAHDDHEGIPKDLKAPGGGMIAVVAGVFVLLLVAIGVVGLIPDQREKAKARDEANRESQAKPVAIWTTPEASTGESEVNLPCDVEANQSTPLYTRANGFLAALHGPDETKNNDLGSVVKKGQILAIISTPDVDAQEKQSEAALEVAQANVHGAEAARDQAKQTYQFNVDAQKDKPGSVSQEALVTAKSQLDQAEATLKQTQANVSAAQANVNYEKSLQDFEFIRAPFDGVITYRKYDVGQYLSSTQTAAGQEVYDVQQVDKLRVFVNVPQGYANNVKVHQKAHLLVRNFPGKAFEGEIAMTAGALDPNTRTLRVQVDFDNKDGKLFAGEYGELKLPVTAQVPVKLIPSSGLIFNDQGLTVATIGDGDKIHNKKVKVGRDFGVTLEVTEGLESNDRIVLNPGERFAEGVVVDPRRQAQAAVVPPTPGTPAATTQPATTEPSMEGSATTQPMR